MLLGKIFLLNLWMVWKGPNMFPNSLWMNQSQFKSKLINSQVAAKLSSKNKSQWNKNGLVRITLSLFSWWNFEINVPLSICQMICKIFFKKTRISFVSNLVRNMLKNLVAGLEFCLYARDMNCCFYQIQLNSNLEINIDM